MVPPGQRGGSAHQGGLCCYYYYSYYCCGYYCSCLEIGGRGVNCFSCCCYCCYCCCCYCYCSFCSPTTGRAPNIITPLIGFPLMGRAPNIIIFSFPLVGRGIKPDISRGWGILTFSLKFISGVWKDSPFNSRLKPSKRAASLACLEAVFLIIYGVTPVIWTKVSQRGAALPRAKLRNITRPSLVSRASRNSLARQAPWRPPPGTIEFIKTRFL